MGIFLNYNSAKGNNQNYEIAKTENSKLLLETDLKKLTVSENLGNCT